MSFKYVIIVAVVLTSAGVGGLFLFAYERNRELQELLPYKQEYSQQADELLTRFENQSNLTPEEQLKLLQESSMYGTEWKKQQKLRLRADLDQLAAGDKQPNDDYAVLIYGENWQQEVEEYRKNKEAGELVVTLSALSFSLGVVIFVIGTYRGLVRIICGWLEQRNKIKKKIAELIEAQNRKTEAKKAETEQPEEKKEETKLGLKMVLASQAGDSTEEEEVELPSNEQVEETAR